MGPPPFILKRSEGEEMEAEEWQLIEAASDRVDRSLEIIDRILNNFRETVLFFGHFTLFSSFGPTINWLPDILHSASFCDRWTGGRRC